MRNRTPRARARRSGGLARRLLLSGMLACSRLGRLATKASVPRRPRARAFAVLSVLSARAMASDTCAAVGSLSLDNPLLADGSRLFPRFASVKAEHVAPGVRSLLAQLEAELTTLEAAVTPTWPGLVEPLEKMSDALGRTWGVVSHLKATKDSEPLRAAYDEVQPEKVKLGLRLAQSEPVFAAFEALKADSKAWAALSPAQKRVVEGELRDAVLSGVALRGEQKERYNAISQELSALSTKFSNNVLDSTKAFTKIVTDAAQVAGLPPSALAQAAQTAAAKGHPDATPAAGPWAFTLDIPSYQAVQMHCSFRPLREELYRAYLTRASVGDLDNGPLISKILALKGERSRLLGFDSPAAVSFASKMATLPQAEALLEELRAASYAAAEKELAEVRAFAAAKGETAPLVQWDITFWAERLREERYDLKEEELRPYFQLPKVLDGMFSLAQRLFGVQVQRVSADPATGEAIEVWHPDVSVYSLVDPASKAPLAYFYLDPYSRPAEKRGGAWMDEVVGRSKLFAPAGGAARLPVAHMVCNGTPPVGSQPSLMTFREVETLLHEFGHALQHMLTRVDEGLVSGIRGVEWDAVELPSQFMENWAYVKPILMGLTCHVETGEQLPEALFQKLVAAKTYRAASQMLRQIHFASVDLELHARFDPAGEESIFDVDRRIAAKTSVMQPLPEDRFLCGFSHIFAGGYSAGYFSYKWAEVLSADAFGAFEEAGLDNPKAVEETGRRFRETVMGLGGSVPPAEVFVAFRGREPSTTALLRHSGLLATAAA